MIPEPRLNAGDSLAGRYVLRGPVGRGPMGLCWLADDMSQGGEVVLKIVDGSLLPVEGARNRFVREALRYRAVQSQYLARLLEAFVGALHVEGSERPADHAVLVYERLPGFTLRRLVERRSERGLGPFSPPDLRLVLGQLATGLHAVHRAGLVHGNLKPENVFLTSGGVRLGDLALAPALGVAGFVRAQAHSYGGRFLAPEICRGSAFEAASDLYALGALLVELVGGEGRGGRPKRDLPPALRSMLARATSDVPATRYGDAHQLAAAFVGAGKVEDPDDEESSGVIDRPPRSKARERVITAMGRAVSALTDEDIEELEPTRIYKPAQPPSRARAVDLASAVASVLETDETEATVRVSLQSDGTVVPSPPARRTPEPDPTPPPAALRRPGGRVPERRHQQRTIIGAPATVERRRPARAPVAPKAAGAPSPGGPSPAAAPAAPSPGAARVAPSPGVAPVAPSPGVVPARAAAGVVPAAAPAGPAAGVVPRLRPVELPDLRPPRPAVRPVAADLTPAMDRRESPRRGRFSVTPTALAWLLIGMGAAAVLILGVIRNVVENRAAERLASDRIEKARRVEELRSQSAPPEAIPLPPAAAEAAAAELAALPEPEEGPRCPEDSVRVEVGEHSSCVAAYEFPGQGKRPRTGVSLGEAQALCATTGARLCRNEEWERACTGADGRRYPYGDDLRPRLCHLGERAGRVDIAGRFGACRTPDGIHDLLGNAAEWVAEGVLRGGDARVAPAKATCTFGQTPPSAYTRDPSFGFRCCWDLPQ